MLHIVACCWDVTNIVCTCALPISFTVRNHRIVVAVSMGLCFRGWPVQLPREAKGIQ